MRGAAFFPAKMPVRQSRDSVCGSYVLMEMEPLVGRQSTLDEEDGGDDEESGL